MDPILVSEAWAFLRTPLEADHPRALAEIRRTIKARRAQGDREGERSWRQKKNPFRLSTSTPIDAALVRTNDVDWIDTGTGNQFKVLRISKETGAWSALIKAAAGQVNAPHTHLGPADFYVISGGFDYRGGSAEPVTGSMSQRARFTKPRRIRSTPSISANVYGPVAFPWQGRRLCRASSTGVRCRRW